jgi:hypothetical protein
MADEPLIEYRNPVYLGGYRWLRTNGVAEFDSSTIGEPGWFLATGLPLGEHGRGYREYEVFSDETGLFRTLAATEPTPDGIRAFARRYGLLGEAPWQIILSTRGLTGGAPLKEGLGEPLLSWKRAISQMHAAVSIWDMARSEDVEGLRRRLRWSNDSISYDTDPDNEMLAERGWFSPSDSSAFLEHVQRGNLTGPALYLVEKLVNDHLKDRTSARLQWEAELGRPRLHLVPGNLLGALWLQFAQAVHSEKAYRVCPQCGKWFEAQRDAWHARSDRRFCSQACRSKAYRTRKEAKPKE